MDYRPWFETGLSYDSFLEQHATDAQRERWDAVESIIELDASQREVLNGFSRQMHVLCMAGAWCGDCVEQCPIFKRFAAESSAIDLRLIDRDAAPELAEALKLCGAPRVPQVIFLNEDFEFVGRYGDRTLAKYRDMAAKQLGAACPTGLGVDSELTAHVTADWLDEFERIHWLLRLSPRLRQRHND